MRELVLMDWRLVQLFLDDDGISEVELDVTDNRYQRCSCKTFSRFSLIKKLFRLRSCKHVEWVEKQIVASGGHYSIQIPMEVPEDVATEAFDNADSFRDFVIHYARVEVL